MKVAIEVNLPEDAEALVQFTDAVTCLTQEPADGPIPQATVAQGPATPAEPAQEAPAAEPASTAQATDVDIEGIPWDPRIHAASKAKTKTGHWRKKKGVAKEYYEGVLAELKSKTATTPATPATPTTPAEPAQAPAAPAQVFGGDNATLTWDAVFKRTADAKITEQINDAQVNDALARLGVSGGFPGLATRPDKWEEFLISLGI